MQLDGPFGPSEAGPVEHRQAEIDRGGVQADQLVLESELLPGSSLHPTALEELKENLIHKAARGDARWHRPGWTGWERECPGA